MVCKSNPSPACCHTSTAFLADAMLGRLAKWLRLLGFDTLYAGRRSDHQLAALARAEGRILLTRDREMTRRRGIRCLYVDSQLLEEQLAQVIADLGLSLPHSGGARCPQCNEPLAAISRTEARPCVPAYVWKTHSLFHRCPACHKVYWPGSHWEHIQATIDRVVDQM